SLPSITHVSNTPDNNRLDADQPTLLNIEIIVDEDVNYVANEQRLRDACTAATSLRDFHQGEIGIRVTTDAAIHQINRDHLGHDYPTDVISFAYAANRPHIEGELVVSVDTAAERANELGWSVDHELLLYVVHGTLHITGMDDHEPKDRLAMRCAEREIMLQLGVGDIDQYAADGVNSEGNGTGPRAAALPNHGTQPNHDHSRPRNQPLPEDLA
ncbi:MAG: rRNA maturation RNase YbeY, partial [Rubripirellula sp.]